MATDIVLKDRNGQDVTYSGIETVTFNTPTEGVQTTFTHGKIMEGVTIEPNFSKGDQVISVPDGSLVKEATIVKPAALVPENIRAGTNVAGVVGELIGDTEEVTVDLDMAEGGQVITPTAEGKVMSKVIITKPGTMVPENIKAGIDIGGVVGEYVTPGTTKEIEPDFSEGNQTVTAKGDELWNEIVVKKPETLIPENIVKDVEIGGVVGTFEGGGGIGSGAYNVKVVDYDGTVLAEKNLDSGEAFELPNAPSHEGLVFDGWSSSATITDNTVTVENNNIMIGPMYHTKSGATEIDIVLTKVTGKTFTFLSSRLTGMTSIDWGDGTIDSTLTHTYSDYGKYTIKIYGMTAIATGTSSGGIATSVVYPVVEIRLAATVTSIGSYGFTGCYNMTSISIPKSVISIGDYVFSSCYALKFFVFPSGITSIGSYIFSFCRSLWSVVFPSGVTSISRQLFQYCYGLTSVVFPSGVTSIGLGVFLQCQQLKSVIIPGSVTTLLAQAFDACPIVTKYDFTACTSVPSLSATTAFRGINGSCEILVSSSLYSIWIAATNWSTYADYIVAV